MCILVAAIYRCCRKCQGDGEKDLGIVPYDLPPESSQSSPNVAVPVDYEETFQAGARPAFFEDTFNGETKFVERREEDVSIV